MSDIVQRLRQKATDDSYFRSPITPRHICDEAADEIKRLRGELADRDAWHWAVMDENCSQDEKHCACVPLLRKEVERLRNVMDADDRRLQEAGVRVGIIMGCDTPDAMADEIEQLREQLDAAGDGDTWREACQRVEQELNAVRQQLAEEQARLAESRAELNEAVRERDNALFRLERLASMIVCPKCGYKPEAATR